jgi:hypothetical protein
MHEKSTPASHATQHGGSAGVAAHAKRTLTVRAYLSAMGTAFGLGGRVGGPRTVCGLRGRGSNALQPTVYCSFVFEEESWR